MPKIISFLQDPHATAWAQIRKVWNALACCSMDSSCCDMTLFVFCMDAPHATTHPCQVVAYSSLEFIWCCNLSMLWHASSMLWHELFFHHFKSNWSVFSTFPISLLEHHLHTKTHIKWPKIGDKITQKTTYVRIKSIQNWLISTLPTLSLLLVL